MEQKYIDYKIVFFDGECAFCDATVDLIYRKNKKRNIYFASLQSCFAKKNIPEFYLKSFDTIVFYSAGKTYERSTALLHIANNLQGAYRLFTVFFIIPRFIRDGVYKIIAKIRHKIFGKKDTCRIMTTQEKNYFLE